MNVRFAAPLLLALWCVGCDQTKKSPTEPAAPVVHYDSIVVCPIEGEMKLIKPPDGLQGDPRFAPDKLSEQQTLFRQTQLPALISQYIANHRATNGVKVIAPQIVQERRKPGMTCQELGTAVGASTVLVGKAEPDTQDISFQLIVVETGKLLWGGKVSVYRNAGDNDWPFRVRDHTSATNADATFQEIAEKLASVPKK